MVICEVISCVFDYELLWIMFQVSPVWVRQSQCHITMNMEHLGSMHSSMENYLICTASFKDYLITVSCKVYYYLYNYNFNTNIWKNECNRNNSDCPCSGMFSKLLLHLELRELLDTPTFWASNYTLFFSGNVNAIRHINPQKILHHTIIYNYALYIMIVYLVFIQIEIKILFWSTWVYRWTMLCKPVWVSPFSCQYCCKSTHLQTLPWCMLLVRKILHRSDTLIRVIDSFWWQLWDFMLREGTPTCFY